MVKNCPLCDASYAEEKACPACGHPRSEAEEFELTGTEEAKGELIQCPACGQNVSNRVEACPNCACPDPSINDVVLPVGEWILLAMIGFLLSLTLVTVFIVT